MKDLTREVSTVCKFGRGVQDMATCKMIYVHWPGYYPTEESYKFALKHLCPNLQAENVIWVKINEALGFSGISMGSKPEDVDNHIPPELYKDLLGFSWEEIEEAIEDDMWDKKLIRFLKKYGWKIKPKWYRHGLHGTVYGACFEKGN